MKDHPAFNNGRVGKGPRTKKKRKYLSSKALRVRREEERQARLNSELEVLRAEPTLHSIDWKA